jgi:hypothetical protein
VALTDVSHHEEWRDVTVLDVLARELRTEKELSDLLEPQGPSRVPTNWLR